VHGEQGGGNSHDGDGIVVEDSGDIFRGELVGGIADEETSLADCTIADDDAPARRAILVMGVLEEWRGCSKEAGLETAHALYGRDHHVAEYVYV
jgi:hypothetical protein